MSKQNRIISSVATFVIGLTILLTGIFVEDKVVAAIILGSLFVIAGIGCFIWAMLDKKESIGFVLAADQEVKEQESIEKSITAEAIVKSTVETATEKTTAEKPAAHTATKSVSKSTTKPAVKKATSSTGTAKKAATQKSK